MHFRIGYKRNRLNGLIRTIPVATLKAIQNDQLMQRFYERIQTNKNPPAQNKYIHVDHFFLRRRSLLKLLFSRIASIQNEKLNRCKWVKSKLKKAIGAFIDSHCN